MLRILLFLLLLLGLFAVLYPSWLSSSDLRGQIFIPGWLGDWTDNHVNSRTAVPLVFLGLVSGIWLVLKKQPWRLWLAAGLALSLIVIIAEVGQLFLPKRKFGFWDIAWGIGGAFLGLAIVAVISILIPGRKTPSRYARRKYRYRNFHK